MADCLFSIIFVSLFMQIPSTHSGILASIAGENESLSNNDTLIFAHVVSKVLLSCKLFIFECIDWMHFFQLYRHGEANIEKVYPNDPYRNESYWPGGYGQLTNVNLIVIHSEISLWLLKLFKNFRKERNNISFWENISVDATANWLVINI